jgi:NADPH:quinone reductase-like Zn-dependent oxidoreductase
MFDSGAVRPVIDRHFPLSNIGDAHNYMASNANVGKVVIDIQAA